MEFNLRESGYRMEIPDGRIAPFEEKILASGLCDFALDMSFSRLRGKTSASYDCTGYVAVRELDLTTPQKVFEVLEKTLLTMTHAGEFFIDRDKVLLNADTVFYNRRCKDVRIAYFPRSEGMEIRQSVEEYVPQMITVVGELRRAVAVQGIGRKS